MTRQLIFTVYENCWAKQGLATSKTWEEWLPYFAEHAVRETPVPAGGFKSVDEEIDALDLTKNGDAVVLGLVSGNRQRTNVVEVHALGLDLDHSTDAEIERVLELLHPYEYAIFTTHKSGHAAVKGETRLRVVLPLAQPIPANEHPECWLRLNAFTLGKTDQSTKDCSRLFYMPSTWDPTKAVCFAARNVGEWLDPRKLEVAGAPAPDAAPSLDAEAECRIARAELRRVRSDSMTDDGTEIQPLVKALLIGDSYAGIGERHRANLALTMWIAQRCKRRFSDAALQLLFAPSLTKMAAEHASPDTDIASIIVAYEGALRKIDEAKAKREADVTQKAREAQTKHVVEGQGSYTLQDLTAIAAKQGWQPEELQHRWVVQKATSYYFLSWPGVYRGPYAQAEARSAAVRHLARSPVQLFKPTQTNPEARVTIADLVEDYGIVCKEISADLMLQESYFDASTEILHEATAVRRILQGKYHADFDAWCKIAGRDHYEKLLDWLACVPDTTRQLCALYVAGPAGSGKTMLAQALAKIWINGGPPEFERVTAGFNEELSKCPLVLADESLPDWNGKNASSDLRRMIGTMDRTWSRKHLAPANLHGNLRVMLAANHEHLLQGKGVFSRDDQTAIAQRVFFLSLPKAAVDFYEALPTKRREEWLNGAIAEHAIWLWQNRQVQRAGRFWVEGEMTQMVRGMIAGSEWNSLVLEACARYLIDPSKFASHSKYWQHGAGHLLVNPQGIVDAWQQIFPSSRRDPETSKITSALRAISQDERPHLRRGADRVRYYDVDLEQLWAFVDQQGLGDRENLQAVVNRPVAVNPNTTGGIKGVGEQSGVAAGKG